MSEWTEIRYGGTTVYAMDFLNGVLVKMLLTDPPTFVPGYYVQEKLAYMDGPALRPIMEPAKSFAIRIEEEK